MNDSINERSVPCKSNFYLLVMGECHYFRGTHSYLFRATFKSLKVFFHF